LVAVAEESTSDFEAEMHQLGYNLKPLGWLTEVTGGPLITIL
jgi:hypothetical protein